MHCSNHDNRLQRPDTAAHRTPRKFLSLERDAQGSACACAPPPARPVAALAFVDCVTPNQVAKAQLGYDPFAANLVHNEEQGAT